MRTLHSHGGHCLGLQVRSEFAVHCQCGYGTAMCQKGRGKTLKICAFHISDLSLGLKFVHMHTSNVISFYIEKFFVLNVSFFRSIGLESQFGDRVYFFYKYIYIYICMYFVRCVVIIDRVMPFQ